MREVFTKKLNEVWQRGRGRAHRSSQVWQAARGENRDRALSDKRVNTLSNKWMEEEQFQRDVKAQFTHIIKRGTEFSPTSLVMQIFPLLLVRNHIWKTQQQSLEYVFCWVHISTQDLWFWPFGKQRMIILIQKISSKTRKRQGTQHCWKSRITWMRALRRTHYML